MANCVLCKSYYRRSQFNPTNQCDSCLEEQDEYLDDEDIVDIYQLVNPTGKTPAKLSSE